LGQAFVDDYRLIRANAEKNYDFHTNVVSELIRLDELGGEKLEQVWNELDDILIAWDGLNDEQRSLWPDDIAELENYFYDPLKKPEIDRVLSQ
jgi:hypothetical protein